MIVARHEEEAALAYVVDDGPDEPLRGKLCVYARRGRSTGGRPHGREDGKQIAATFGFQRDRPLGTRERAEAVAGALAEALGYLDHHRDVIEALR